MKRRFKPVSIFVSLIIVMFVAALCAVGVESATKAPDPAAAVKEEAVKAPGGAPAMQGGPAGARRGKTDPQRKLFNAPRSAEIPLNGAKIIRIDTHVGRVEINAVDGADAVRASGTALALKEAALEGIRLSATREKDAILIRGETPGDVPRAAMPKMPEPVAADDGQRGSRKKADLPEEPDAFLNLAVTVPPNLPLEVKTVWGDVTVIGASSLALEVNRGNVMLKGLTGDLRMSVTTGEINVIGVAGDVDVVKGDGEMILNTVGGSVLVRQNPFGEMRVINVKKDVRIVSDGLGDIMVDTVGGDLVVESDAGGDVKRQNVAGKVQVPEEGPPKEVREKKKQREKPAPEKAGAQKTAPEKREGEKRP